MTLLRTLAICAMLLACAGSASAQLLGDSIHGELLLAGNNYFDPALGLVPPGSNPLQPDAVVSEDDSAYTEFTFWIADPVTHLGYGVYVDVDDDIISIELRAQKPVNWNAIPITISDLGDGTTLEGMFVGQNDVPGSTVTHDATSVTVTIPDGHNTPSGTSQWIILGLEGAVPTEDASIGSVKARFN